MDLVEDAEIVIKTAAVSDYRPVVMAEHKIKKNADRLTLELEKTRDILKEIGHRKGNRLVIGFAAETQNLRENATQKLTEKKLDLIVGNVIGAPDSGFALDTNQVTFFFPDGSTEKMEVMDKGILAHRLLDRIATILDSDRRP
jgi:phosphopantothenoylcysteine decarboxylase/phosphopantothenate--cysteine ligase